MRHLKSPETFEWKLFWYLMSCYYSKDVSTNPLPLVRNNHSLLFLCTSSVRLRDRLHFWICCYLFMPSFHQPSIFRFSIDVQCSIICVLSMLIYWDRREDPVYHKNKPRGSLGGNKKSRRQEQLGVVAQAWDHNNSGGSLRQGNFKEHTAHWVSDQSVLHNTPLPQRGKT